MKWSNVPDKKFTVMVMKALTRLERRADEHRKTSTDIENMFFNKSELKNTVNEMKNILEGIERFLN